MKAVNLTVRVTEELAYRINMKSSYEYAGRELLKAKLKRLVDHIVDTAELVEQVDGDNRIYTLRIGYDRKEEQK